MGVHFDRGQALFDLKRYREAIAAYGYELRNDPDNFHAWAAMAAAMLNANQPIEATHAVSTALSLNPELAYGYYLLSYVEARRRRPQEALQAIYEALRLEPCADFFFRLAEVHEWLGNVNACLSASDKALQLNPRHQRMLLLRANVLAREGKRSEAAELLRTALALNPEDAEVQHAIGALKLQTGRSAEAVEFLREARRTSPVHHNDRSALAAAYGRLLLPLRLFNLPPFRYQFWSPTKRWLLFAVISAVTLPLTKSGWPPTVVAALYSLALNAVALPATLVLAASSLGSLKYRRDLDMGLIKVIPFVIPLLLAIGIPVLLVMLAIVCARVPAIAWMAFTLAPSVEIPVKVLRAATAANDPRVGCFIPVLLAMPTIMSGVTFVVTDNLVGPSVCSVACNIISFAIVASLPD